MQMLNAAWKRYRLNVIQSDMSISNGNKKTQKSIKLNANNMLILFDNGKLMEINMELCLFISA